MDMTPQQQHDLAAQFVAELTDAQVTDFHQAIANVLECFSFVNRAGDDPEIEFTDDERWFDLQWLSIQTFMGALVDEGESRDMDLEF